MDNLSIKDVTKYIAENHKKATKIDLDDNHPSYIYNIKERYWIVSVIEKLDKLLQKNISLEDIINVLKFSFNTSAVFDSLVAVNEKEDFVVQRLVREDEKSNIEDIIYQHEAYTQHIVSLLYKNNQDLTQVASPESQVLRP
jgi:seryl-tRNA(Sec) selenium transferase